MQAITVQITASDIEQGAPGEADNPVARALRRATGIDWIVMYCMIAVEANPPYRTITLPLNLYEQLKEYERSRYMSPVCLEVSIPPEP